MTQGNVLRKHSSPLVLGGISAVLYGTVVLMPLFLVPVQVSARRDGFKPMLESAAVSAVLVALWQLFTFSRDGSLSLGTMLIGLSAPAGMLLALILMAWPRLARISFVSRSLAAALLATAISLPTFFMAASDPAVRALFVEAYSAAIGAAGGATTEAEAVWQALQKSVLSSFGAMLFLFLFVSAWFGTRLGAHSSKLAAEPDSSDGVERAALPPRLAAYRVPTSYVWVLLAAWAGLLINRFIVSTVLSAVALNAALALSICYGVQGFAVAGALAERVGMATALRVLGPIAFLLLLLSGTAGLVAVGLMALLGTLETWIPFRAATTKGDTP
ncbi:MAG: hypothetical protein JXM71_04675 [Spirochaetales bacterium]|nr:hypothetical protein [Spirochaetales bacterium]